MLQTKSIGKSYLLIANGLAGTTHVTERLRLLVTRQASGSCLKGENWWSLFFNPRMHAFMSLSPLRIVFDIFFFLKRGGLLCQLSTGLKRSAGVAVVVGQVR